MAMSTYKSYCRREGALILLKNSRICPFKWKNNKFTCIYCDESYADPVKLREHNHTHTNLSLLDVLKAINKVGNENIVKTDVTDVSCKLCDVALKTLDDLKDHLINEHNFSPILKSDSGILAFKLNTGSFICGICDNKFTSFLTISRHIITHFQTYICEQCGSGFATLTKLRNHYTSHLEYIPITETVKTAS